MRIVGRLLGVFFAFMVTAAVVGLAAARSARERLVRRDEPDADEVGLVAILEPLAFESRAATFRGGTVDCWYGGGVIDLRAATLDPAGATLRVRALFGGGQVIVPEDWRVETRVVGIGGVGDGRSKTERPATAPLLRIEGWALFGGFGVTSSVDDEGAEWLRDQRAHAPVAETPVGVV